MYLSSYPNRSPGESPVRSTGGSIDRQLPLLLAQSGNRHLILNITMVVFIIFCFNLLVVDMARAHGGKTHQSEGITALEAVQTATGLFERLLEKGKLDDSWESGLVKIRVSHPTDTSGSNFAVSFHRRSGTPEAVYIFISTEGKYAGSNFTGR